MVEGQLFPVLLAGYFPQARQLRVGKQYLKLSYAYIMSMDTCERQEQAGLACR